MRIALFSRWPVGVFGVVLLAGLVTTAAAHGQAAAPANPAPANPAPANPAASPAASPAAAAEAARTSQAAPAPPTGQASATSAPAAAEGPAKPTREATGYAPASIRSAGTGGKAPKAGAKAAKATTKKVAATGKRKAQTGGFVIQPGFEAVEGGGSRVFVELGQSVPVEERKAKGTMTFVLKGAHNAVRNNFNPLVTEHFNTPVRRARLVPAGRDLHLLIELRQDAAAAHRFVQSKEGHAVLQVDFGAGTFLKESVQAPEPAPRGGDGGEPDRENAATDPRAPQNVVRESPSARDGRPAPKGPQP